jgi:cytochrome c peroxidase
MKKLSVVILLVALIIAGYSCRKTATTPSGHVSLDLPATPYIYSDVSTDSAINYKATLGRVLFYDNHLSINNSLSCASCHKQVAGFADNVPFSTGYEGRLTKRNSKNIANLEDNSNIIFFGPGVSPGSMQGLPLFWDGREDILNNLVARPITNHVEMGFEDFSALPQKLAALPYYGKLFADAYSGDSTLTTARISECVGDFLSSINCNHSRVDQFMNNGANPALFSALEYKGYTLFVSKYNCDNCHHVFQGMYGVEDFKDIGLDQTPTDLGRGVITGLASDNGKFKVPNLHNVALSAPYMHDGRYKTLSDVIDHYSHGISQSPNLDTVLKDVNGKAIQMNIPDEDKQALIAFLTAFTDYTVITDPKFSNPFKVN